MPSKYSRLAVAKPLADEFSLRIKRIGRKPSEVVAAVLSAVIDAVDHGVDPMDMIHICRVARSIGLGKSGYEAGLSAGVLLRAYYKPKEFIEVIAKVGPQMMGVYRVTHGTFRVTDSQIRETVKGLFIGIGCRCEEHQEFLKVHCD